MGVVVDFVLLALIYFMFFFGKWKKEPFKKFVLNTFMYTYIVMVFFVTLMPFPLPFTATNHLFMESTNFTPFRDVRMNYNGAVREIILNIIMTLPFGFLYPVIKNKGFLFTIFGAFLFSLFIETSQLLMTYWASFYARSFDVTDLITNTVGGCFGYLIYKTVKLLLDKIDSHS